MADGFGRYLGGDARQRPVGIIPCGEKRSRDESEIPNYYGLWNNRAVETPLEGFQHNPISLYGGGDRRAWTGRVGIHNLIGNPSITRESVSWPASNSRFSGSEGRPEIQLPPYASNTLFVQGLPADCTLREVSHIFRPFIGFKEARLVTKESKRPGGDPLVLCFVDFESPAQAAKAMDTLQGYKFDELDSGSTLLKLQFARHAGARSGGGYPGMH